MKAMALINKSAGAVARNGDIERAVRDGFAERGVEADVRLVNGREVGELSWRFVAENKSRSGQGSILVVGGGDGTLHSPLSNHQPIIPFDKVQAGGNLLEWRGPGRGHPPERAPPCSRDAGLRRLAQQSPQAFEVSVGSN